MLLILPSDLIRLIGFFGPISSVGRLMRVNKYLYQLFTNDLFWSVKYTEDFNELPFICASELVTYPYRYQYEVNHGLCPYRCLGESILHQLYLLTEEGEKKGPWDLSVFDESIVQLTEPMITIQLMFVNRFAPLIIDRENKSNRVISPIYLHVHIFLTSPERVYHVSVVQNKDVTLKENYQASKMSIGNSLVIRFPDAGEFRKYLHQLYDQDYWPLKSFQELPECLLMKYSAWIE